MADEVTVWIDSTGAETTLKVDWDVANRFAPPVMLDEDSVPEQDGERLRAVRFGAREFSLPLWIDGVSPGDLRTVMRTLVKVMNPKKGDGRIRVTSPLGDQREIVCRAIAGLDMREKLGDTSGPTVQKTTVLFKAWDPLWRATSDIVTEYQLGTTAAFFPIFPLRLASSEVFVDTTITNDGDAVQWPVWTLTGPGSSIVLQNLTTAESLVLSTVLGVGETITIDTQPGVKTVVKNDGSNLWPDVDAMSVLWGLAEGANAVRVQMAAATTASQVRLARRNRYLSV